MKKFYIFTMLSICMYTNFYAQENEEYKDLINDDLWTFIQEIEKMEENKIIQLNNYLGEQIVSEQTNIAINYNRAFLWLLSPFVQLENRIESHKKQVNDLSYNSNENHEKKLLNLIKLKLLYDTTQSSSTASKVAMAYVWGGASYLIYKSISNFK